MTAFRDENWSDTLHLRCDAERIEREFREPHHYYGPKPTLHSPECEGQLRFVDGEGDGVPPEKFGKTLAQIRKGLAGRGWANRGRGFDDIDFCPACNVLVEAFVASDAAVPS